MHGNKFRFFDVLDQIYFVDGQELWEKRKQGISEQEFQEFTELKWSWYKKFNSPTRLIFIGYLMLVAQAFYLSKGSLVSAANILLNLNPVTSFLATAGTIVTSLAPLILITREFQEFQNSLPRSVTAISGLVWIFLIFYSPWPIVVMSGIFIVVHLSAIRFKHLSWVQNVRLWALFNLPSLGSALVLWALAAVLAILPISPMVVSDNPSLNGKTFGLVKDDSKVLLVEISSGQTLSLVAGEVGNLRTCIPKNIAWIANFSSIWNQRNSSSQIKCTSK